MNFTETLHWPIRHQLTREMCKQTQLPLMTDRKSPGYPQKRFIYQRKWCLGRRFPRLFSFETANSVRYQELIQGILPHQIDDESLQYVCCQQYRPSLHITSDVIELLNDHFSKRGWFSGEAVSNGLLDLVLDQNTGCTVTIYSWWINSKETSGSLFQRQR